MNSKSFFKATVIFLFSTALLSCVSNHVRFKMAIVSFVFPVIHENLNVFESKNYFGLFEYGNFKIYELPYYKLLMENDTTTIKKETFLIFYKNELYGKLYKDYSFKDNKRVMVDSLLNAYTNPNLHFYNFVNDEKPITVNHLPNDIVQEIYVPTKKGLPTYEYNDTTYIFYSKRLAWINYSISDYLDSSRNSKVKRMELVFNSQKYKEYQFILPKRKIVFDIEEVEISTEKFEKIKLLVEHYKKNNPNKK